MNRTKVNGIRNRFLRHCKLIFPIILIFVVAITVATALKINRNKQIMAEAAEESASVEESVVVEIEPEPTEAPKAENVHMEEVTEDQELLDFVTLYLAAEQDGAYEVLNYMMDTFPLEDRVKVSELAKYTENYELLNVYSKTGYTENALIVFLYYTTYFTNYPEIAVPGYQTLYIDHTEDGTLYIRNDGNSFTEEENEYIKSVLEQVDVIDFHNRVTVEYDTVVADNPELAEYIELLKNHVNETVGEAIAQEYAESQEANAIDPEDPEAVDEENEEEVAEEIPQYAYTTANINVRDSDSENAEKLGTLNLGAKVEIIEIRVNGWTKIKYDKVEGFIKSEYLKLPEDISTLEVIGIITANTTVNVRAAADAGAMKLGMLSKGASLDLFAVEDGWCKVNFNDQVAYVKADYVTQK